MEIEQTPVTGVESTNTPRRGWSTTLLFVSIAVIGGLAAVIALVRTDDDPLALMLASWPNVLLAGLLYGAGMVGYSISWAMLFAPDENRRLLASSFVISQPLKYVPSGITQPVGQIVLGTKTSTSRRAAAVAFPVHVLLNVEAAVTLGAPLLLISDVPSWSRWLVLVVPLFWAALDRSWMAAVLRRLGRLHRLFDVANELPERRSILRAFPVALVSHGLMFTSFGLLAIRAVPRWSVAGLAVAYAIAWLVGYVALPAPAGLGAREAVLVVLLSASAPALAVVEISAVHRVVTLVVELLLLVVALVLARRQVPSGRTDRT